jgi:hypothetical protein
LFSVSPLLQLRDERFDAGLLEHRVETRFGSLRFGRTTTLADAPRSAKLRPLFSADARAASNCALILSATGLRDMNAAFVLDTGN